MNRLLIFFTILFFSVSLNAADSVEKILEASKSLVSGSNDPEAIKTLQASLDEYEEAHVRGAIVEIVSYSLLSGDGDFDTFRNTIQKKYPQVDFSFVERNEGNYKTAIKTSAMNLVLNASSTRQAHKGNSPRNLTVKVRERTAEPEVAPFEADPVKVNPIEPVVLATVIPTEIIPMKSLPTVASVSIVREQDVAKESIYYKVYHAAVKIKAGNTKILKDMIAYTFEEAESELTAAIVKAMTVGMLSAKSKLYSKYKNKVSQQYSDNTFFIFLDEAPFLVDCPTCKGAGHTKRKCRSCLTGDCRSCKGQGIIEYKGLNEMVKKACPVCRGAKKCLKCEGEKVTKKDCRGCGARGVRFNRGILPVQYKNAIQYIIDITPKIASDNGLYIGVGANPVVLARVAALKAEKAEKRLAEEEASDIAREKIRQEELAQLQRQKEKDERDRLKKMEGEGVILVETPVENGVNGNLEHSLLEVRNWFTAQEKRSKTSINKKCSAKYSKGNSVLYIDVSKSFQNSDGDYKEQIADGCYRYWKLRLRQNGAGGNPVMIMQFEGEAIAVAKDGVVTVK